MPRPIPNIILAGVLLLAGCGGDDDAGGDRPGAADVYAEIDATTECSELQAGFDRNMDDAERREPGTKLRDVVLSYADAYDDRMKELGCYDE